MRIGELLQQVGRPVAYYPNLVPIAGSVPATVLLCQLLYWDGKQHDPDGWIYKTQAEITEETGLSRYEQEGARKKLRETAGILQEKRAGVPAKLYFRIDHDALQSAWDAHPRMQKTRILGSSEPTVKDAENPQSLTITETTAETTQRKRDPELDRFWGMTLDYADLPDKLLRDVRAMQPLAWGDGVLTLHAPAYLARRKSLPGELVQRLKPVAPVALREVRIVNGG